MDKFPIFESDSIRLRCIQENDFDRWIKYVNDDFIKKQFVFDYTIDTAKERMNNIITRYSEDRKPFIWVIALKETDEMIGIISLDSFSSKNKNFSIAYGILEEYRGNNYAYIASYIIIDYFFNAFKMHRLQIAHSTDNTISEKIIQKLGVTFEGVARESKYFDGTYKDRKIYGILDNEWKDSDHEVINYEIKEA